MLIWVVKTTVEIPDQLFRKVKSVAAERDQSLKEFLTEALQEKLAPNRGSSPSADPPWMRGFGQLRHLRGDIRRLQKVIDDEFGRVDDEDRQ